MKFAATISVALLAVCLAAGGRGWAECSAEKEVREADGAQNDTTFNQTDSKGRKQGYWRKHYRNGKVAYRAQFKDDQPIGRTLRYNENGVLIADLRHATSGGLTRAKIYDDRGQLIAVGNYRGRAKDSIWTLYTNGRVIAREGYALGVKEGVWERYSDGGELAERERWHCGRLEGRQEKYFANGKLQSYWTAREGMEDGPSATLYTSGRPRLKGQFERGKRDGAWVLYSVEGAVQDTLFFERGKLVRGGESADADSALSAMYRQASRLREPTAPDGAGNGGIW